MSQEIEVAFPPEHRGASFSAVLDEIKARSRAPMESDFSRRLGALNDLSDVLLSSGAASAPVAGMAFLAGFLRRSNIEHLLARELPNPEALDRFVPVGERKSLRLLPKGVVCHWIAGNVPLLGVFSWVLSALVGNANLIRLSARQDDVISPILSQLADRSDAGRQLAQRTVLVYFDRENQAAHRAMSSIADVRIAWGGREAVEAIRQLPCGWDCEDITLGPRVSYAVVDPEVATNRAIARLATDAVYFDQLACSSPQYVFVRGRPGRSGFDAFVDRFASSFADLSVAIRRHPLDFAETYQIQLDRARLLLEGGSLKRDSQTQWTVAIMEEPHDGVVCANRFVQVIPFQSFEQVCSHFRSNVQTVITLLPRTDMLEFTEKAARYNVCRFPRPGEGNHFEIPWDGIPVASRLTRWVVRSEPRS